MFTGEEQTYKLVTGLHLHTSLNRECVFGNSDGDAKVVSGHQLLYISGRAGFVLHGVALHFDYDCHKQR